jgi:hypothetical protein
LWLRYSSRHWRGRLRLLEGTEMKRLPRIDANDILLEVEEWLKVMREVPPEEFVKIRSVLNDAYHDIVNDQDLESILTYSRVTQESYSSMNLLLPDTEGARSYIAKGCTFIPVMLELIGIGYEIARKKFQQERVKIDTPVTH